MKALGVFVLLVFFSCVSASALYAQQVEADLEVVPGTLDFSAPGAPPFSVGTKIKIVVSVKNTGIKKLEPVDVEFWAGEEVIGEVDVGALLPGETKLAVIFWIPSNPGQYTIYTVGDPRRLFDERDEGNNRIDRDITIRL